MRKGCSIWKIKQATHFDIPYKEYLEQMNKKHIVRLNLVQASYKKTNELTN